jgi:hypothetical protein
LSGGTTEYEAIKRAWDLVGTPHVLKELNWCGRVKRGVPTKKGVEKLLISKEIMSK